ncbi:MAG: serine/threonine-protein kinase HipA [Subtercola sp.]|nr:serine/threonine-protein kinase HipA [Subtercola sp.]
MTAEAYVFVDGERGAHDFVGTAYFTQRRGGPISTTFRYEQTWLAKPGAYALEPELPLIGGAIATPGKLPDSFSDASPDRWGRGLITKRRAHAAGAARPTVVDFLLGVSDHNRQGALRFKTSLDGEFESPTLDVPKMIELPALLRAADDVTRDPDNQVALKRLLDAGTGSLGGARPKASVRDGDLMKIAKFPNILSDDWDVMAWECTSLALATRCRITVPPTNLVSIDGRHVLVLDRFDRMPDGARRAYISAMTIVGGSDGERHDYLEVVEAVEENGSRVAADLRELWRRVALSVIIHNTDDHLRNHGFLRTVPGGWALAPAFDINPDPDLGSDRVTSICGAVRVDDEVDGLMELAGSCRLTESAARDELQAIADLVAGDWERIARSHSISEGELKRFTPVFSRAGELGAD